MFFNILFNSSIWNYLVLVYYFQTGFFVIQSKSLWLNLETLGAFVMGLKVSVLGDFQLGGSNF